MRRGLVQDYANQVCQIFVGWRLLVSPGDLARLVDAGKGRLELDLKTGAARIDGSPVEFAFGEELRDWLRHRADEDGLGWTEIRRADLVVDFACARRPGRKPGVVVRELAFDCGSTVETSAGNASTTRSSREVAVREGDGPWVAQ
jgi:hypothetical protein